MGIRADQYFWFDGVEDVGQANWGRFWRGKLTDGVLAGYGQNLAVSANSSGMYVHIAPGEAFVYGVRVFVQSMKVLALEVADAQPRIDLIVVRAVFGNDGQSYAELAAVKGAPGASPIAPAPTRSAGQLWEVPLARVSVGAGVPTIAAPNVTDAREWHVLPVALGGTGAINGAGIRYNAGITYGHAQAWFDGVTPGGTAAASVPGLPDGGLVWIEPTDQSWNTCNVAGVRYYSHAAGVLHIKATTNPGAILLNVGWLKIA